MALLEENVGKISGTGLPDRKRKKPIKRRNLRKTVDVELSGDTEERGVVYLSHIPHGFYEPQMRHFFAQFGQVTRLKLWRSKKSGKPRGFAYIEFEYVDVAKIVADTMNNYLMFQKLLKCQFIPNDSLCRGAFSNSEREFVKPYHRKLSIKRHNSLLKAGTEHILQAQKRLVQMEGKRRKKMAELGIECNLPGYSAEWKHIKKAQAIVSEERRMEALREKAIELKRQEALKKAKLISKTRRMLKRQRRSAEKQKAKGEKQEEAPDGKPQEESSQGGSQKSPKRKSSAAVVLKSSDKVEGPPRKKRGKVSAPKSPGQVDSPPASPSTKDEQAKLLSTSKTTRRGRMSVKGGKTSRASPAVKLSSETPKITSAGRASAKSAIATPTSSMVTPKKSLATPKSYMVTRKSELKILPKTPAEQSQNRQAESKTPRSGRKVKTSENKLSSTKVKSEDAGTKEESKMKEFTGIQLAASAKKADCSAKKKATKKQKEIKLEGDQLLIF